MPSRELSFMKILTPSQLQKADAYTIDREKITSWQLMERASLAALEQIKRILKQPQPISVLAGSGNNGGDGLAIAFHLHGLGYKVNLITLKYTAEYSKDCKINLERLKDNTDININEFTDKSKSERLNFDPVIIDAVFGIGLNRALPEFVQRIIEKANLAKAFRISIDVPSGLFLSRLTPDSSIVFQADHTLTFQCPKLNFFLPDFGNSPGIITVIDIGLDQDFISGLDAYFEYVTPKLISKWFRSRKRFSHKGTYGHLLIIGGQYGMMGSVCLTAKAALRSGAGKTSVLSPKCGLNILQQSVPEAMVITSDDEKRVSPVKLTVQPTNICLGMGIGTNQLALKTLSYFITQADSPMVIDADGLNILSENRSLLKQLPSKSILTPHQGELKKLIGQWADQYDKLQKMQEFVEMYDLILVSKDAFTFIISKESSYINSTGNAGMATAGSGDALSGIISGLLVQGYSPLEASVLGVYFHGQAGDIYAEKFEQYSLMASDIIDNLGNAFSFSDLSQH
jgi:hydroxyethylthiazole kinase-like uncharacterized protein yjeF